ncbi:hypothetical protein [Cytobacillus oceanisediminis]|uniref:hypothetical protein n=1 Tax=Cytobacillus oceanisediminis TaxID=665099 RepID=UPI00254C1A27|nr:hypothetical protein [Cytobacillus oceanisediminis]MDK7668679.1 hypothetical protein [Cytobacillus oceanisediminis]
MTNQSKSKLKLNKRLIGLSLLILAALVYFASIKQNKYNQTSDSESMPKQDEMEKGLQENVQLDNNIPAKVIVDEYVDWYAYAYDSIKNANTELAAALKTGDYESAKDSYESALYQWELGSPPEGRINHIHMEFIEVLKSIVKEDEEEFNYYKQEERIYYMAELHQEMIYALEEIDYYYNNN